VDLRTFKGASLQLANRELGGRNGDPAMTMYAHHFATDGTSSVARAHVVAVIRPSLDLSGAQLLLLSCP
jgi:hypothetical protein